MTRFALIVGQVDVDPSSSAPSSSAPSSAGFNIPWSLKDVGVICASLLLVCYGFFLIWKNNKERLSQGGSERTKKTLGVILTVIGAAVGAWTILAFNALQRESAFKAFDPNYKQHEMLVFVGGAITVVLLIVGLTNLASSYKKTIREIVIDADNNENNLSKTNDLVTLHASVADEIKKFAELRDAGVITEEEFQSKKNSLL